MATERTRAAALAVLTACLFGCGTGTDSVPVPGADAVVTAPVASIDRPPATVPTTSPAADTTAPSATIAPEEPTPTSPGEVEVTTPATEPPPATEPSAEPPAEPPADDDVFLRLGDEGPEVASMQAKLASIDYLAAGFDSGVFDESTRSGLRQFQADYGLGVDGIFGPITLRALNAAVSSINGDG